MIFDKATLYKIPKKPTTQKQGQTSKQFGHVSKKVLMTETRKYLSKKMAETGKENGQNRS